MGATPDKTHLVGAQVPADVYEAFREIAESEHRTMSGELRRLIDARIAEYERDADDAA